MKFTGLSTILLVLPLLAQQVSATPLGFNSGVAKGKSGAQNQIGTGAFGGKGANTGKGGNTGNAGKGASGSSASSVAASQSSVAVASVSSSAVSTSANAAAASSTSVSSSSSSSNATANNSDPQNSLTLDPAVIATGFEQNGQETPTAGQVASLTSNNNFINFCLTSPNLPLTNGLQIKTGSCNPAPMGIIAATTNMPSAKFTFPTNGAVIQSNTAFTVSMAISNLETGNFVNAEANYFSAPQQINSAGDVQGHSHVVMELLSSFTQTTTTNPNVFAFFKGLNDPAQNGVLTADVTAGLPAGTYRLASINTAANHQPVLVAVAQHGSLDDMVYFTVSDNAGSSSNSSVFDSSSSASASDSSASATASSASDSSATASVSDVSASVAATSSSAAATATAAAAAGNAGKTGKAAGGAAGKGAKGGAAAKGGNNKAKGGFGGFGRFKLRRSELNRL